MVAPSGTQTNGESDTDREAPLPQPNKSSSANPEYVDHSRGMGPVNDLSNVQHLMQMDGSGQC